jgi:hypothetical protein
VEFGCRRASCRSSDVLLCVGDLLRLLVDLRAQPFILSQQPLNLALAAIIN